MSASGDFKVRATIFKQAKQAQVFLPAVVYFSHTEMRFRMQEFCGDKMPGKPFASE